MSESELFADRMLSPGLARMSEAAAIAAARLIGRGDEESAERDEVPMLYVGEKVGTGNGPAWLSDHFGLTAQGSAASGHRALAYEAQRCALAHEAQRCVLDREAQ